MNSRVLGSRVQITIDFSNPARLPVAPEEPTSGDSFGLRVCQAIAQSHGGDIRFFETSQRAIVMNWNFPYITPHCRQTRRPRPPGMPREC